MEPKQRGDTSRIRTYSRTPQTRQKKLSRRIEQPPTQITPRQINSQATPAVANKTPKVRSMPRFTHFLRRTTLTLRSFISLKNLKNITALSLKRKLLFGGLAALLISGTYLAFVLSRRENPTPITNSQPSELVENVEYQTILPKNKTIAELGGWRRVSPPDGDPVFAYIDKINEIPISVSQQPIPKQLMGDVDKKIEQLAKDYSATKILSVDTAKVYVGTSTKGPQSVLFVKNNLLIMIKSQKNIDDNSWTQYIRTLN